MDFYISDPKYTVQLDFCIEKGLFVKALTFSPIKGPKGNIEYLVYLTNQQTDYEYNIEENPIDELTL